MREFDYYLINLVGNMDITLFFSWQMETDLQGFNNKRFLNHCIEKACKNVSNTGKLNKVKIRFQEGMRASSGTPEVAREMFRKIDQCDIYVADITTAQRLPLWLEPFHNKKNMFFRYSPNGNVFGEYNRALGKYPEFDRQIILLANDVNKTALEDNDVIPFDTRGRRWPITFHLENNLDSSFEIARKALMPALENAIRDCALEAVKFYNNRYYPFVTWYKHIEDGRIKGKMVDDEIVKKYQSRILSTGNAIRISGPNDFRKAYLAMKSFEDSEFTNQYFYGNFDDNFEGNYYSILDKILKENEDVTLILDHCSNTNIIKILGIQKKYAKTHRIIFLTSEQLNPADGTIYDSLFDDNIDITDDLMNHMEQLFAKADIRSNEIKEFIIQFCDNNENLIDIVLSKLPRGIQDTDKLTTLLTNIITSSEPDSFARTIWLSISLFDNIGRKKHRASELEYIITNKSITARPETDEYIINAASPLIKRAIEQGWVMEKENTISIVLQALANQLVYEWFSSVDIERFKRFLKAIEDSPYKTVLLVEFHDRLGYMASNEEMHSLVSELLKPNGTFDSSILQSNEGLFILETFAAANSEAVTSFLMRHINAMSEEQITSLRYNSTRLIWLIEKLCFCNELFNRAALLMLRLANTENTTTSSEATSKFTQLFPVFLPATSANLDTRYEFLKNNFGLPEHKALIIKALNSALLLNENLLLTGSERLGAQYSEPYMPKTKQEAAAYLSKCLNLIEQEIDDNGQYTTECIEIVEKHMLRFCANGYAYVILPYIERIAKHLNYDWAQMQEHLVRFKQSVWNRLSPDSQATYDNLISKLTKTDIVSVFARIDKELIYAHPKMEYTERVTQKEKAYENLAKEAYEKGFLTDEILEQLMCLERGTSHPFGATLAKCMSAAEQLAFIKRYLAISNVNEKASNNILCDFISGTDESIFDDIIIEVSNARITNTIFICFGDRNILPSNEQFSILHQAVETHKAPVDDYLYYFYRLRISEMSKDVILGLLTEINSHPNSFETIMHICSMLNLNNILAKNQELLDFVESTMTQYMAHHSDILSSRNACEIGILLLQSGSRHQLAIRFNEAILNYAAQQDIVFYSSYEMEQIYSILIRLYFNEIWPMLSEALLSDGEHYMTYFHLKSLLSVSINEDSRPILLESKQWNTILEWCKQYPDVAPARIAGMIPVIGENDQFSIEAKQLIDLYADQPYVLNEISCSMESFSSIGSVIPYYEHRKRIYQSILNHSNARVRLWAQQQINGIDQIIEMEQ